MFFEGIAASSRSEASSFPCAGPPKAIEDTLSIFQIQNALKALSLLDSIFFLFALRSSGTLTVACGSSLGFFPISFTEQLASVDSQKPGPASPSSSPSMIE